MLYSRFPEKLSPDPVWSLSPACAAANERLLVFAFGLNQQQVSRTVLCFILVGIRPLAYRYINLSLT